MAFIKNQKFNDPETLEESVFDFHLGEPGEAIHEYLQALDQFIAENAEVRAQTEHLDQEERDVYLDALRMDNILDYLLNTYPSFEVKDGVLYGIGDQGSQVLFRMPPGR